VQENTLKNIKDKGETMGDRIAIHTSDGMDFPNYALMKLSAWHKQTGDSIEWYDPVADPWQTDFDKIYSSKVFTFTEVDHFLPKSAILGGTGYGLYNDLPDEIDAMFPDYSIYPYVDYAIGFLTRGCPNKCSWCIVPEKEGEIRAYKTWQQIKRADSRDIVFMDNNVLASQHGLAQIEEIGKQKLRIDFNQGLDARLITPEIGKLLGKCKWNPFVRLACDTKSQMKHIAQAHENLIRGGIAKSKFSCYVLIKDDCEDALDRIMFVERLGINAFCQPYRDFQNNIEPLDWQKDMARWVNHKATFKSCTWEAYHKR
jgi:hypothetical protein